MRRVRAPAVPCLCAPLLRQTGRSARNSLSLLQVAAVAVPPCRCWCSDDAASSAMTAAMEVWTQGSMRARSAVEWRGVMAKRQARTEAAAWQYFISSGLLSSDVPPSPPPPLLPRRNT